MSILKRVRTKFAKRPNTKSNQELKSWAQIEYKNDWQMVYNHMLNNDGKAPTQKELS
jgi:hypothetical protein